MEPRTKAFPARQNDRLTASAVTLQREVDTLRASLARSETETGHFRALAKAKAWSEEKCKLKDELEILTTQCEKTAQWLKDTQERMSVVIRSLGHVTELASATREAETTASPDNQEAA